MPTSRLGTFPGIQSKITQDDIAYDICKFFIDKFPVSFFKHVFIDTETGNANNYIINPNNGNMEYMEPIRAGQKIPKPDIRFNIKQSKNNIEEVFGSFWNVNQQPGAFAIDTELTGYKPFLIDPYGIILASNDYPIRNTIEIVMGVNSKADQLALMNILDTNIKSMYGYEVDVDCDIVLPELLMEYIRSCVFKPEINALEQYKKNEDKISHMQEINKRFMEYLYKYSGGAIVPYRMKDANNEKAGVVFALKRKQRCYLKLERYEDGGGNKRGTVFTDFKVTISGSFDYANLISFITSVPAVIRGTKNDWFIRTSGDRDRENYYHTIQFKEVFKDLRRRVKIDERIWAHFYMEKEVLMASVEENFNIIDDIIDRDQSPHQYNIMKCLIDYVKTQEDFDKMFKVIIYKDDEPLDYYDYSIDKNFQITIHNCDLSVPYYIDVFVNKVLYSQTMNKVKEKLDKLGLLEKDKNGNITNIIPNGINNHWKYYMVDKDGNYVADLGNNLNKKLAYTPVLPMYQTMLFNIEDDYCRIKPSLFLIPNPEYDYYIYDSEKKAYMQTMKLSKFKDNIRYFILEGKKKYKEIIDYDKFLIPNPIYKYFIKYNDKFVWVENLEFFDDRKKYYVHRDDFGFGIIKVRPEN